MRGESTSRKKEKEREKAKGKIFHGPRNLIYQSLSFPFTEKDKKWHPTSHIIAHTLIMSEQEAALLSLCTEIAGTPFRCSEGDQQAARCFFPTGGAHGTKAEKAPGILG